MENTKRKIAALEKLFQSHKPVRAAISWDCVPPFIKQIMDDVLIPACEETPDLVILNVLFSQIAAAFSWNKPKITVNSSGDKKII